MNDSSKKTLLRRIIASQIALSRAFDYLLPRDMRVDGNTDFLNRIAPDYIQRQNYKVVDVGGGSQPLASATEKEKFNLTIVGLDIDSAELEAAPDGLYDEMVVTDLSTYTGAGDADLVVCQTTLEHVADNRGAFRGLASIIKPGGYILTFTPSKHAWFAKLNILLPESVKRTLLFKLFPHKADGHDGFPATYDRCSPKQFRGLAADNGLSVVELKPYYISSYFKICFPLYVVWRMWMLAFRICCGENAAETFSLILQKPPQPDASDE